MNTAVLVLRNLARNKLRTGLTIAAVALPSAFLLLTSGVKDVLDLLVARIQKELRLIVHSRVSFMHSIPERCRREIEQLDPEGNIILSVCGLSFSPAEVENAPPIPFGVLAMDADTFVRTMTEYPLTAEDEKEWHRYKNAAVIGKAVGDFYKWSAGQEVEIHTTAPSLRLRLRVIKLHTGSDQNNVFIRRDFWDDTRRGRNMQYGEVNLYWVKVRRAEQMEPLARRIDATFKGLPHETKTEDESTFIANFFKMTGDLPGMIQIVGLAVGAAVVMVVANTMSMAFRERLREFAVLKALGFSRGRILGIVLVESCLLALLGGAFGIVPTYFLFELVDITDIGFGQMAPFRIPSQSILNVAALAAGVGLVSGLVPAYQAARLNVVDALRKVA
jgi:putative ABC transport system permease protein